MSQSLPSNSYDYLIVGAGAAGFNLAICIAQDSFFDDKRILVLDKSSKSENDRFWSYWEKGKGKYDDIVTSIYPKGLFIGPDGSNLHLDLGTYNYKTLESGNFNAYAKDIIEKAPNIEITQAEVINVREKNGTVTTETSEGSFTSNHVFDSRIGPGFQSSNATKIWQHFKGWTIETKKDLFESETFTMMDFSVAKPEHTSFMYVLPFAKNKALIEYTFFDHQALKPEEYDSYLNAYISYQLGLSDDDFKIVDEEVGNIPMTDFPFHKESTSQIIKIGTAGSWVKGSSGYSFRNAIRNSEIITENLKANRHPSIGLIRKRHQFYDAVLLKVLDMYNDRGGDVFHQMFAKNPVERILNFLGEESTLLEEIKVMASLTRWEFTKAAAMNLLGR